MPSNAVFYAWQSDLPAKCNRYFIRDAARDAIEALAAELTVQEAPRLDHDTEGVPGTPDIAQTIFAKIDGCAVFLADVSLVGATPQSQDGEVKRLPNPNVMIELGYALKAVTHERTILVMNTAFGPAEDLPFDLRSRRHPIQFRLETPGASDRKVVYASLVEHLKAAIRAVIQHTSRASTGADSPSGAAERLVQKREELRESALRNRFHGFSPGRGVLAVTVCPDRLLSPVLNFSEDKYQQMRIPTVWGVPSNSQIHGRKLVGMDVQHSNKQVFSVAELQESGVVLAADGLLLAGGQDDLPKETGLAGNGLIQSVGFEKQIAESIVAYLQLLRVVGVRGSVRVAVDLFRVHGFIMGVDDLSRYEYMHHARAYGGDGIQPDAVVFAEEEPVSFAAVAARLRPVFDHIWREFGYPRSLNYDREGAWRDHSARRR